MSLRGVELIPASKLLLTMPSKWLSCGMCLRVFAGCITDWFGLENYLSQKTFIFSMTTMYFASKIGTADSRDEGLNM